MEFTGRILKVMEPRTGTSERTGNEWKTQGFVFEYFESPTDRYSDKVYLEAFNTNVMDQLKEGVTVRIGFGHRVEEYKGNTYNRLTMYKFELQGQSQNGGDIAQSQEQPTAARWNDSIHQPQGTGNANKEGGKADDLPF